MNVIVSRGIKKQGRTAKSKGIVAGRGKRANVSQKRATKITARNKQQKMRTENQASKSSFVYSSSG